jgi:hypothetical protein
MLLYERGTFRCLEERMSVYRLTGLGASRSHHGAYLLQSRAYLYAKLNEHFNGRYEDQIFRALLRLAEYQIAEEPHRRVRAAIENLWIPRTVKEIFKRLARSLCQ